MEHGTDGIGQTSDRHEPEHDRDTEGGGGRAGASEPGRIAALEAEIMSLRTRVADHGREQARWNRDRAALDETLQLLGALVQGSPVPMFMIGRDHRIILWNHALEAYSGIRAGEIVGKAEAWRAFYDTERPTLADLIVDRAIDQIPRWYGSKYAPSSLVDGAFEATDYFPRLEGGTWLAFTAAPAYDSAGAITGSVEVLQDVTEQRLAEEALTRYAERLERSNEELQRFAYVASHDLQEPLRSIISFSQLLARRYKGKLGTDADEYIDFIVDGGNRMQRLIEDLLQFSRVATKGRPCVPTETTEVVAGVLRMIETPIREAGATVEVDPMPRVMADPAQLVQVFANLVSNALKFRRPGVPPVVRVSAERDGRFWRFAVADNGIGIEPEYYDRIFVIFQRLHTRAEYDGTGIGLAVVKRIVERHGGRVWVESVPGEGSTFFFTLPAA